MSDTPEPLSAMNGTDAVLGMEYNGAEGHESDTVASIIAEMRDTWTDTPPSALLDLADRIESAAERERESNQKILAAANDANAILKDDRDRAIQFANAAPHPGSVSWKEMHEVYTKARAILSAVPKEVNAAALREALAECAKRIGIHVVNFKTGVVPPDAEAEAEKDENAHSLAFAALSAPARNCDRFATADDARRAFQDLRGHKILADVELWDSMDEAGALVRWLFAPAEGGDHA